MRIKALNVAAFAVAGQAVLDGQDNLRHDLQFAVHKHVERVGDHTFGGVLHRDDAVIRARLADLGEDIGDGFLRNVTEAGTEFLDGGLMRERRLRPEVGDGHRLFQGQSARHDFTVNGAQLVFGHRPLVEFTDALEHGAFTVRRINFLARLELEFADGEHVPRALIEQPDDLRVQPVDGLAMLGNAHNPGSMPH